jgi:hypothetical protein
MNPVTVRNILAGLRALPFFDGGEAPVSMLVSMVTGMAETEEQILWVVQRMTAGLYEKWPGPLEMRAVYCSKFRPKDGVEAESTIYPNGIPSEKKPGDLSGLPVPELPALPAGHIASTDPEADAIIQALAEKLATQRKRPKKQQLTTAQFESRLGL